MSGGADRAADTLGALFTSAELYTGLATGAVVLVTAGLLAHRWSVVTDPGVLLGAAVVAGLAGEGRLTQAPPLALVPVVFGAALAGGLALVSVERRLAGGLAGPLLAGSSLGVYFTVPETSSALVLLGVSVPVALVVVVGPAARLGVVGGVVGWGAVAWVGAAGGQYRASAVVGALGCAGLFAVEPVARAVRDGASPLDRLRGGGRAGRDRTSVPLALGAHLALVYGAARVAGLEPSGARAIVVLAAVWALGAAALALLAPTPPPDRPRTRASPGCVPAPSASGDPGPGLPGVGLGRPRPPATRGRASPGSGSGALGLRRPEAGFDASGASGAPRPGLGRGSGDATVSA